MRLFVAVPLPDPARDHLAGAIAGRNDPLRWQARHRWHVTLAFLGESDEGLVADLVPRLDRAARRHDPIADVRVSGAGTFGRSVLWAGIAGDGVAALSRLAASVQAACRRSGAEIPARRFRPHVTLARIRASDPDPEPVTAGLAGIDGPPWTVDRIALVRSTLHPAPAYDDLHVSTLGR